MKNKKYLNINIDDNFMQFCISALKFATVFFVSRFVIKKALDGYKIYKDSKIKSIKDVSMVGKIKDEYSREEIRKSINEKNKEYIYVFSNEIMDKFDDKDLSNFYHNISNLKIIFPNFIGRKFRVSTGGIYYTKSNKLFIPKVYENISANHELFHMISTFKDDKKIFSGFSQTTTSFFSTNSIGDGLTEGYTELMTNRYF